MEWFDSSWGAPCAQEVCGGFRDDGTRTDGWMESIGSKPASAPEHLCRVFRFPWDRATHARVAVCLVALRQRLESAYRQNNSADGVRSSTKRFCACSVGVWEVLAARSRLWAPVRLKVPLARKRGSCVWERAWEAATVAGGTGAFRESLSFPSTGGECSVSGQARGGLEA